MMMMMMTIPQRRFLPSRERVWWIDDMYFASSSSVVGFLTSCLLLWIDPGRNSCLTVYLWGILWYGLLVDDLLTCCASGGRAAIENGFPISDPNNFHELEVLLSIVRLWWLFGAPIRSPSHECGIWMACFFTLLCNEEPTDLAILLVDPSLCSGVENLVSGNPDERITHPLDILSRKCSTLSWTAWNKLGDHAHSDVCIGTNLVVYKISINININISS